MLYFPIIDPISDIEPFNYGRDHHALRVFLSGRDAGTLVVRHEELSDILDCFKGTKPVAESYGDNPVAWRGQYNKPHVITELGTLLHVEDME